MSIVKNAIICLTIVSLAGCKNHREVYSPSSTGASTYPKEILDFTPYAKNPIFTGTGANTWDQKIRERGYIMRENGIYYMWYTGYREGPDEVMHLGYATSPEGLVWTRYPNNPIVDTGWVEDMMVIKPNNGTYYMFAEGKDDIAHMLTSSDRIHWREHGPLDIRQVNGEPLSKGPYGTPTVWVEGDAWYLFYERGDLGIWVARSTDGSVWTNIRDEPVITPGPEKYDQYSVAVNQIIKYKEKYYAYYHATEYEDWHEWTSCAAISEDLIHWRKYENNPIMRDNKSSPILVHDGEQYRLYTMHDEVCVHFPKD
jgi:beta-1,2-mannobiose phosphorylase / 1,2-beta-oligomannan phosphorylase